MRLSFGPSQKLAVCAIMQAMTTTVQPSNTTGSFQNQPTNSPVHSVIKTVEFKHGHRVRIDGQQ